MAITDAKPDETSYTQGVNNLLNTWHQSTAMERKDGYHYYDIQRQRIEVVASEFGIPLERMVAAFCALSPNNAESTTYRGLRLVCEVLKGTLPPNTKIPSYGRDSRRAMELLQGAKPERTLGIKTYAFYLNTIYPDASIYTTIDGHMYGCWRGEYTKMRDAKLTNRVYQTISHGVIEAARTISYDPNQMVISAPRFQSVLWITWKRLNNVLDKPQKKLFYTD